MSAITTWSITVRLLSVLIRGTCFQIYFQSKNKSICLHTHFWCSFRCQMENNENEIVCVFSLPHIQVIRKYCLFHDEFCVEWCFIALNSFIFKTIHPESSIYSTICLFGWFRFYLFFSYELIDRFVEHSKWAINL